MAERLHFSSIFGFRFAGVRCLITLGFLDVLRCRWEDGERKEVRFLDIRVGSDAGQTHHAPHRSTPISAAMRIRGS